MSQTEINTELAQKLEDIFKEGSQRKFKAGPPRKKRSKKTKDAAATSEHADANAIPRAVLGKNSVYRQNGSDYLRAQDGRGVYRNFSHKHLNEIRDLARKVAEFPGGPPQNFDPRSKDSTNVSAGAKWPYPWEAHHMIPGDAFTYVARVAGQKGKEVLTKEQYQLLLQSDYDINHGHNIIMLPDQNWAVPIHVLLQHPSNHPEYTDFVIERIREISKDLQKIIDQKKPHKALVEAIFEQMKDIEDTLWDYLVKLSKSVVGGVIEGQEFTHDHVRYSTKDGTTPYKWGALY